MVKNKMRKISKEREEELVRLFGLRAVDRAMSLSQYEDWKAEQAKKVAARKALKGEAKGVVPLSKLTEPLALTRKEILKRRFEKAKKKHLSFVKFVQEQRSVQWTFDDDRALNVIQRRKKQIRAKAKKQWIKLYAEEVARALVMFELNWKKAVVEFFEDTEDINVEVSVRIGRKRIDVKKLLEGDE